MSKRHHFEFDIKSFSFVRARNDVMKVLLRIAELAAMTLTFLVLAYAAFALVYRTDTERRLRREIRTYERIYPDLEKRSQLLEDAITSLQHRDDDIYEMVFHSKAPDVDPMEPNAVLNASDSIPDTKLVKYVKDKSELLVAKASSVDSTFSRIFAALSAPDCVLPPMSLPLKDISYPQVGASTGTKLNPFYKANVQHDGIDFIVSRGTPVYAAADGIVEDSGFSKQDGYTVRLAHAGGYTTIYKHLENQAVHRGQTVKLGQKIGTVGMSGKAFAPHLHYEVRKGDMVLNPVDCSFASVTPLDYANMLYMGVNTKQSMD